MLLFAPVGLARAVREPRLAPLPWLAALAGLLLLLGWTVAAWRPADEAVIAGGVVQALLPINPWPPAALLPLPGRRAAAGGDACRGRRLAGTPSPRPLAWAALPAAVPVLALLVGLCPGAAASPRDSAGRWRRWRWPGR